MPDLRALANEHPRLAIGAIGVIATIAVGLGARSLLGGGDSIRAAGENEAFYSVDDGQSWFADKADRLAPFEHDGQTAVKAIVYRCDGHAFANHLERYTPEGRAAAEKLRSPQGRPDGRAMGLLSGAGKEVKRPGDGEWVSAASPRAANAVTTVRCPEGHDASPTRLSP